MDCYKIGACVKRGQRVWTEKSTMPKDEHAVRYRRQQSLPVYVGRRNGNDDSPASRTRRYRQQISCAVRDDDSTCGEGFPATADPDGRVGGGGVSELEETAADIGSQLRTIADAFNDDVLSQKGIFHERTSAEVVVLLFIIIFHFCV